MARFRPGPWTAGALAGPGAEARETVDDDRGRVVPSPERDCKRCRKSVDDRSASSGLPPNSLPPTKPSRRSGRDRSAGNDHVASTATSLTLVDPTRRFDLRELLLPRADGAAGCDRVSSADRLRGEGGGRIRVLALAAAGRQGTVEDGGGIEFGGGTDVMDRWWVDRLRTRTVCCEWSRAIGNGFGRDNGDGDGGEDRHSELSSASPESIRSMGVGREARRVRGTTTGLTGALAPNPEPMGQAFSFETPSVPSSSHNVGRDTALELARGFLEISCSLPIGLGLGRRGAAL